MADDLTMISGQPDAPYLAVDVLPDNVPGTFLVDVSEVDGPDLLGWGLDGWLNIVCDVDGVEIRRGATRLQGALTRTEAGTCQVSLQDTLRRFDPMVNADAIHPGTPVRVRAWGSQDVLAPVESRRNLATDPSMTSLTGWAGTNATLSIVSGAMRVTPSGTNTDSSARRGSGTTFPYGMQPGRTYTVSAELHLPAAQAGSLHAYRGRRLIVFVSTNNGGAFVENPSPQVPNVAGARRRVAVTVTLPANATGVVLSLNNGSSATTDVVQWDSLLIEESSVDRPYFDGSSVPYYWTGTADASVSVETATGRRNLATVEALAPVGGTLSTVTDTGRTWTRVLQGASPTAPHYGGARQRVPAAELVNGATYTAGVLLRNPGASPVTVQLDWCDQYAQATTVVVPAGQELRASTTAARATYDSTYRFLDVSLPGAGTAILVREPLVELGTVAGVYFDGSTAAEPEAEGSLSYGWTGTPNASASVEYAAEYVPEDWDAVLFTGRIGQDLDVAYQQDGPPLVSFTAVDLISPLASYEALGRPDPGAGAGQNLLERVHLVLEEAGLDPGQHVAADVDTGYAAALAPTSLTGAWGTITAAEEAELGRVWVNVHDQLVTRARGSQLTGNVRGTLSDLHGEAVAGAVHCCYRDPLVRFGTESLTNRAIAGRRVPNPGDESTPAASAIVQVDDAYSQARWTGGTPAAYRNQSLDLETDDQLQGWAEWLVLSAAEPELRVDSVTLDPYEAPEAWQALCETDLGDRWYFRLRQATGPAVERTLGVLGIVHNITPEAWETTLLTVEAPTPGVENPSGWFTVDLSELDGEDVLAPFGGAVPA